MEHSGYDALVAKMGGRFQFAVLVQKRVRELVRGATPLVEIEGKFNPLDVALREVMLEKVSFEGDVGADLLDLEKESKSKE